MQFEFITTFYPKINQADQTVTLGYNQSRPKIISQLQAYKGKSFIHSGNWWNIDPKTRTLETVRLGQEKLYIEGKTIGFMSLNVPASLEREDYWNLPSATRQRAIETCLKNADWALENYTKSVPIYCSLEVTTFEEAKSWFKTALDRGHTHFCRGVAEFLSKPKFRKEGLKKIFEFLIGAQSAIKDEPLHLSGSASPYFLPLFCYLGVSSVDGSTPVTSGLGRGTVYDEKYKGHKVRSLKAWNCKCAHCSKFNEKEILKQFNESGLSRVLHNLEMWKENVKEIQSCQDKSELRSVIETRIQITGSKYLERQWDLVKVLLKKWDQEIP